MSYCDHSPSSRRPSVHNFLLTLASTNIDQSAPNLVRMYINHTRTVQVICPWIRKFAIFDFVNTSICKYWPISTKLGHNIYAHKVSDELDYGLNWTRTSGVICPWIWKNCWIWLCLHSIIYKYWPIRTKLGQNVCDHKILDDFNFGSNRTRTVIVICPWIRKFAIFDLTL